MGLPGGLLGPLGASWRLLEASWGLLILSWAFLWLPGATWERWGVVGCPGSPWGVVGCPEVAGSGGTEVTLDPPKVCEISAPSDRRVSSGPSQEGWEMASGPSQKGARGNTLPRRGGSKTPHDTTQHHTHSRPPQTTPQHTISHTQTLHTAPHHTSNPTTAQHQTTHHGQHLHKPTSKRRRKTEGKCTPPKMLFLWECGHPFIPETPM